MRHPAGPIPIPDQPLIGLLTAGADLDADRGGPARAEKRKNLVVHLGDQIAFSWLVGPGPRRGQAVSAELLERHHLTLSHSWVPEPGRQGGLSNPNTRRTGAVRSPTGYREIHSSIHFESNVVGVLARIC